MGLVRLAPVAGRARIEVLDILRGMAILGIFYMNIPFMGGTIQADFGDPRLQGWTHADRITWSLIQIFAEGTQRGLLELLFGAGMMILTAKAMEPTGPVAVADLYFRRTLWLLAFGLADVFLLLWPGDILNIYALAALFLFPFRKLPPRALIVLGLVWASFGAVNGANDYAVRSTMAYRVDAAQAARAAHRLLTPEQRDAVAEWNKLADARPTEKQKKDLAAERGARRGPLPGYARWLWVQWVQFAAKWELPSIIEAFSTMLIGIALFKLGIIQGRRSRRFYLVMLLVSYGVGLTARTIGVAERTTFLPIPKTIWITEEYARLAVTFGHVALVNLLVRSAAGARLLAPFRAAGRTAFSLYVCETIVGMWLLFPGFGLGWWDRFGWTGLAVTATVTIACLLALANLWSRWFLTGPLEWAWRSLAYCRRQPFRRQARPAAALMVGP